MNEKNAPKIGHEPHDAPFDMFETWFADAKRSRLPIRMR